MKDLSKKAFKKEAKKVKEIFKSLGIELQHGNALEFLSKWNYNQSWNSVSKKLTDDPINQDIKCSNNIGLEDLKNHFSKVGISCGYINNKPIYKDFSKEPNALYCGSMGTGKTESVKFSLLSWLSKHNNSTKVFIADVKAGCSEYSSFLDKSNIYPVKGYEAFENLINFLYDELRLRDQRFNNSNYSTLEEFHEKEKIPTLLSVLENLPNYLNMIKYNKNFDNNKNVSYKLRHIMRVGRSQKIWFLVTSSNTMNDIHQNLESNFVNKFIFKTTSVESNYFLGNDKASKLLSEDRGFCYTDSGLTNFKLIDESDYNKFINNDFDSSFKCLSEVTDEVFKYIFK